MGYAEVVQGHGKLSRYVWDVTAGDTKIATADGEAMFFHDTIDFSEYAGTDLQFTFVDSAGKTATAYGDAAGGGETLGTDVLTNGDFSVWTDPTFPDAWTKVGTHNATNYVEENASGLRLVSDGTFVGITQGPVIAGKLYKGVLNVASISSGTGIFDIDTIAPARGYTFGSSGEHIFIKTVTTTDVVRLRRFAATDYVLSSVSVKAYTDIPATGLHLVSTSGGATRNMTSVDAGFNPNDITQITIANV